MTESQLFERSNRIWQTLQREKAQRQMMLVQKPHSAQYWLARIDEIDQALKSVLWLKDQLKPHAEPDLVQAPLFDSEGGNANAY